jgi:hypothetical protein
MLHIGCGVRSLGHGSCDGSWHLDTKGGTQMFIKQAELFEGVSAGAKHLIESRGMEQTYQSRRPDLPRGGCRALLLHA